MGFYYYEQQIHNLYIYFQSYLHYINGNNNFLYYFLFLFLIQSSYFLINYIWNMDILCNEFKIHLIFLYNHSLYIFNKKYLIELYKIFVNTF